MSLNYIEITILLQILLMTLQLIPLKLTASNSALESDRLIVYVIWLPTAILFSLFFFKTSVEAFEYYDSFILFCIVITVIIGVLTTLVMKTRENEVLEVTSIFTAYMLEILFSLVLVPNINFGIRIIGFFIVIRLLSHVKRVHGGSHMGIEKGVLIFAAAFILSIVTHRWLNEWLFNGILHLG
ncbi:MAG: hypothetical protein IKE52_07355 [Mogibacterium sp.]|nr:hypothetical protein [Mogibacterium sp.]